MSGPELSDDALSAYLDGELDEPARRSVEARLATDPEWTALLAELTEARSAVRALPVAIPPAGFWDEVRSYVATDGAAPATAPRAAAGRRAARLLASGAAAAAVVGAFLLTQPADSRGSDAPVRPVLPALADSHAVSAAQQSDPLSALVPVAVQAPIGK
jgi:anti-sigma factor RsiW